jgi:ABC-2 type transport system permease protein
MLKNIWIIGKRELKSYFESPSAYVFLSGFLILTGVLTFFIMTPYYEAGQADLRPFFRWHPWVYLLLVPAASMGLLAEERRAGTIELLLTLPVTMSQVILGKFLASWVFLGIALILTAPIVVTTIWLGDPDMGIVVAGYLGSFLLAGTYLAVGMLTSALTRNQVISFVLSLIFCIALVLTGLDLLSQWAPNWLAEGVAAFSVLPHYASIQRGVIDLRDVAYFVSMIAVMLFGAQTVLENRKGA